MLQRISIKESYLSDSKYDLVEMLGLKFVGTDLITKPRELSNKHITEIGDCTVRAVSILLGLEYKIVYAMLSDEGFEQQVITNLIQVVSTVCDDFGYKTYRIPLSSKLTFATFMCSHKTGIYLLASRDYIFAYVDGIIYDLPYMRSYDVGLLGTKIVAIVSTPENIEGIIDHDYEKE